MKPSMKIRVAFDCMGTLYNPHDTFRQATIVLLYKWFQSKGCEMYIWSSDYSLAKTTAELHNLTGEIIKKHTWGDVEREDLPIMTINIDDDRSQTYLASEKTIMVGDVHSRKFDELFGELVTEEYYRKQATERFDKMKAAEALVREVEFSYPQGHPFRRQMYRGVVNTFSYTGNEISQAMQTLKDLQDVRLESALKCDRCEEWMEMGLSDTCPGCDMLSEGSDETKS